MKSERERKAEQRARDRALGYKEIVVKVHKDDIKKLKQLLKELRQKRECEK